MSCTKGIFTQFLTFLANTQVEGKWISIDNNRSHPNTPLNDVRIVILLVVCPWPPVSEIQILSSALGTEFCNLPPCLLQREFFSGSLATPIHPQPYPPVVSLASANTLTLTKERGGVFRLRRTRLCGGTPICRNFAFQCCLLVWMMLYCSPFCSAGCPFEPEVPRLPARLRYGLRFSQRL